MLTPKIAVVAVAIFGLGGAGVVAASTAGAHFQSANNVQNQQVAQNTLGQDDNNADEGITGTFTPTWVITPNDDLSETENVSLTGVFSNENKVAIDIANFYSVPVTSVLQLHLTGWGFGEIQKLFSYAIRSGKTISEVETLRDSGMGWGNIAKALGLKPGNEGDNLGGIISGRLTPTGTMTTTQSFSPAGGKQLKEHADNRNMNRYTIQHTNNGDREDNANFGNGDRGAGRHSGKP